MPTSTAIANNLIRDVWRDNLEEEFEKIRQLVPSYNYISIDTEFPGVVARPLGEFRSNNEYMYQLLKVNVDMLKIIQLGITLADEQGKHPKGPCTWQFNFKFSLNEDMYAQDSIDLLNRSGIQFKRHEEEGIAVDDFAELLIPSGLVLVDTHFVSFHSPYDFGYLLKILTCKDMPTDEEEFFELLRLYFPIVYDIKYLMKSCKTLKGGLQETADHLEIERIGSQHQAGSDSLLTSSTFFKMRRLYFEDYIDLDKYSGRLYGLSCGSVPVSQIESRLPPPPPASLVQTAETDTAICAQ